MNLLTIHEFISWAMKIKGMTNSEQLLAIQKYSEFLESFKDSYICAIDDKGDYLYRIGNKFGYYQFNDTREGLFVEVSEEYYAQNDNRMIEGEIKLIHKGRMYIDSKNFWRQCYVGSTFGMTLKKVSDVFKYKANIALTKKCEEFLGINVK